MEAVAASLLLRLYRNKVGADLRHSGAEPHRFGWMMPQYFGIQSHHGFRHVKFAGALMVNDSPAVAVEPDRIVFERFSGYRTKQGQVWGPPVWEYAARR